MSFMSPKIPKVRPPISPPPKPLEPTKPAPAPALTSAIGDTTPPVPPGQQQLLSAMRRQTVQRPRTLLGG